MYIYIYIYVCVCVCVSLCSKFFLLSFILSEYIYIYTSAISSKCPEDYGYGIFVYRIYEGLHLIQWEWSMYVYYYRCLPGGDKRKLYYDLKSYRETTHSDIRIFQGNSLFVFFFRCDETSWLRDKVISRVNAVICISISDIYFHTWLIFIAASNFFNLDITRRK